MTLISLCMICKNEEKMLERCLNSVRDIVDEIIIVDTGSTDQTITIAKRFAATIVHYKWTKDFSAARNIGLEKATGKWILFLDADEELHYEDKEKLHYIAQNGTSRALFLKQSVLNDVKALSILHDCSLVEALLHVNGLPAFQIAKLKKIIPRISGLKQENPVVALQIIEKELGFSDYLKKQGNEGNAMDKGSDDLNDLKVVAKKFSTVSEFLQHTEHMTQTQKALKGQKQGTEAGVQLMTIHRSKGLEFKHVYVIGAVDGSLPHDFSLESARKGNNEFLEEERRLLYVAMTRAKEHLLISIPANRRRRKAVPSRFLRPLLQ